MADALTGRRNPVLLAALAVTCLGVSTQRAAAQPVSGLYVGAGAGYGFLQAQKVTSPATDLNAARFGGGIAAVGSIGYGLGNGLRVELEGDWRKNWQSDGDSGNGTETKAGVMVNALFDMDLGLDWVVPYVGLGGGYQWARWSGMSLVPGLPGEAGIAASGTQGAPAYQAILGASVPIQAVPGLSVSLEYRYLGVASGRTYEASSEGAGGAATTVHSAQEANHAVLLGLRYALFPPDDGRNVPRPKLAVPSGATIPVRTYLVFFDWDSAALSARARDIIAEAVRNSVRVQQTRFEVTGHADRTGGVEYNQALSLRRAQAVAAEVERWGIPPQQVDVRGVGDTQPLVPTAAGVREPQNRRVEIVYR